MSKVCVQKEDACILVRLALARIAIQISSQRHNLLDTEAVISDQLTFECQPQISIWFIDNHGRR